MTRSARPWSLEQKIRRRLAVVTAIITILTTFVVLVIDRRDFSELPQRSVLGMVQHVANAFDWMSFDDLAAPHDEEIGTFYTRHPEAYGWRVLGSGGVTLATSAFDWSAVPDIPVSGADEWSHALGDDRWVAGKTFHCEDELCQVQVIVLDDPEYRLLLPMLEEIGVHVPLPIVPFAALMLIFSGRVIRDTLRPLRHLVSRARAIREFRDVEPIEVGDAPAEVRDLADTLNATLARLRDAMERERAFILDASHSLRTPLAALKSRLEVDHGAVDAVALRREIDALVRLCSQMLNAAHVERLVVGMAGAIDLEAVVVDVATRLEPLARASGVELAYERGSPATTVRADPDAVAVALTNLVENAIQHAPASSEVLIRLSDGPMRISVSDGGCGIPADRLGSVTERFARGDGAAAGGAGLGLSIASRIMTAHGGRLELTPSDPTGLTATLAFVGEPGRG